MQIRKACINLLRKLIEIKSGSRIKVSELNKVINEEIKVSSQVIKQLIKQTLILKPNYTMATIID